MQSVCVCVCVCVCRPRGASCLCFYSEPASHLLSHPTLQAQVNGLTFKINDPKRNTSSRRLKAGMYNFMSSLLLWAANFNLISKPGKEENVVFFVLIYVIMQHIGQLLCSVCVLKVKMNMHQLCSFFPPLIAFELLSKLTKLSRNKAGPTWRLKQMQSDFSSVLLIKITPGLGCCTLTTDAIHPSRFKLSVVLLASWSVTVMLLATLSKTFSGLPGIIKPASPHFKLDVPIWCNGWRWWGGGWDWSPIMLCLDETMKNGPSQATCQYQGWRCTHGPGFLFNPVFL